MMTAIANFVKQHVWGSLIASFVAGAGAVFGTFVAIEQARVDRFEASMMSEYQAVANSKRELYTALDRFSALVAQGEMPDSALIMEMNARLLELHQRVDIFDVGLTEGDREKIAAVKSSLAEMKVEIARTKSKDDLQYLAGRVAQFEGAYKAVRPIVERKVGVPSDMLSG